jgi:hypothetical protein
MILESKNFELCSPMQQTTIGEWITLYTNNGDFAPCSMVYITNDFLMLCIEVNEGFNPNLPTYKTCKV